MGHLPTKRAALTDVLVLHQQMAPQVLHRVCHGKATPEPWQASLLTIKPAILHAYCRHKVRDCDYPAIIPSASSTVRGTVVTGLTTGDLWRLDIFEGDEYARKKVKVRVLDAVGDEETGSGNVEGEEEVEVETYIWIAGEDKLEDGEWDFKEFQKEKMKRWVGEDGEYAGRIRPSILRWSFHILASTQSCVSLLTALAEVDEAVKESKDPTGGRGNGSISRQLAEARDDLIGSAV